MIFSAKNASDEEIICRGIELLSQGVVPLEQWAVYFANEKYSNDLELRPKAFFVWFTTMIDFQVAKDEINSVAKEMKARKIDDRGMFRLLDFVKTGYSKIFNLYSHEEQIFISERRQQIVHGFLHSTVNSSREFRVWSKDKSKVEKISLSKQDYISLMSNYFKDLKANSDELVQRLVNSQEFNGYTVELRINHNLPGAIEELISNFGVG